MRLQEYLRLQVKVINFGNHRIIVRSADRVDSLRAVSPGLSPVELQRLLGVYGSKFAA
jgi:hypothetical protein